MAIYSRGVGGGGGYAVIAVFQGFHPEGRFSIEATSNNSVELVKLYKNAAGPIRLPHSQAEVDLKKYVMWRA